MGVVPSNGTRNQNGMANVPKTRGIRARDQRPRRKKAGPPKPPGTETDRELVRRAQADDKEAFEELVRRHQPSRVLPWPEEYLGAARTWKISRSRFS